MVIMPSYTIRYPHPVSKVTWHPVDSGIRITIFAASDEISPPKSPDLSAQEEEEADADETEGSFNCPRTPSAISLVVHPSGLNLYGHGQSSPVTTRAAELVLPDPHLPSPTPGQSTDTNSITILTPSSYTTGIGMFASESRVLLQPSCNCGHGREDKDNNRKSSSESECECLSMDKLETLQDVLAEERKSRPTLEERVKMPIVSVPRTVRTGTALASFDLAFLGLQQNQVGAENNIGDEKADQRFEVTWEESD